MWGWVSVDGRCALCVCRGRHAYLALDCGHHLPPIAIPTNPARLPSRLRGDGGERAINFPDASGCSALAYALAEG